MSKLMSYQRPLSCQKKVGQSAQRGYQLENTKIHKRGNSPVFELELSGGF